MDIAQQSSTRKSLKTLEQQIRQFFISGRQRSGNECVAMVTS